MFLFLGKGHAGKNIFRWKGNYSCLLSYKRTRLLCVGRRVCRRAALRSGLPFSEQLILATNYTSPEI